MKIFLFEDETHIAPRNAMLPALKGHSITLAREAKEATKVWTPPYDLLLLDFDVCGWPAHKNMPGCGYEFVVWMVAQPWPKGHKRPRTILHSQNTQGRKDMRSVLEPAGFVCEDFYFSQKYIDFLRKEFPA